MHKVLISWKPCVCGGRGVPGLKLRNWYMLGKHATSDMHTRSWKIFIFTIKVFWVGSCYLVKLLAVNPLVDVEVRALAEAFSALPTLVGPLSGVDTLVDVQVGSLTEAHTALLARIRLLTGVDSLVDVELWALAEALPTPVTLERFLTGMDGMMDKQTRAPGETLPALVAFVRFLSHVDCLMRKRDLIGQWSPCHNAPARRLFLSGGLSDDSSVLSSEWSPHYTDHACTVVLKWGFSWRGDHLGWW